MPRRREIIPFISATSDFLCRADLSQVVADEHSPGAQGLGCQRSRHCLGISESFRSSSEGAQARSGHKNIDNSGGCSFHHEATDLRGAGWLRINSTPLSQVTRQPCVGSSYDAPLSAQQPHVQKPSGPRRGHEHGRSRARGRVGQTRQGTFAAQAGEFFPASGVCLALPLQNSYSRASLSCGHRPGHLISCVQGSRAQPF